MVCYIFVVSIKSMAVSSVRIILAGSPKDEGQDISHSILYDCNATHMFT